jgi:hypothetical protein
MKERLTVKIHIEPYLKAFLLSCYNQEEPIFFPKKDKLNDLLQILLSKPPRDHKPVAREGDHLEVVLPYFENINIMSYHYLSSTNQRIFARRVRQIFWVTFEDFMDECFRNDMRRNDAIYLFIEKYNLPVDSRIEDMLRKEIYRSKRIFRKYPKRDYRKSKKQDFISSDKGL